MRSYGPPRSHGDCRHRVRRDRAGPAIDAFVQAGGEDGIPQAILGVKREYLEAAVDEMERNYGTIDKYFAKALGIDDGQQEALRELYLGKN